MADVNPIPEGRESIIPYLATEDAQTAIDFYTDVFGAEVIYRLDAPGGGIAHSEVRIGGGVVYLADGTGGDHTAPPSQLGRTTVSLSVYVSDVDEVFARATAAGATAIREPDDEFYGDRRAAFIDPFGHGWSIASHVRDVSEEEIAEAMAQMGGQTG